MTRPTRQSTRPDGSTFEVKTGDVTVRRRTPIAVHAMRYSMMMLAIAVIIIPMTRSGNVAQPSVGGGGGSGSYTPAPDSIFNSNEPGCDGTDPTVKKCEDWERKNDGSFPGSWYELSGDSAAVIGGVNVHTKGWWGGGSFEPHPIIYGGGVDCSDTLVVGFGTCTAHLGEFPLSESGIVDSFEGDITQAKHSFANGEEFQELYIREYFWHSPGFVYSSTKYQTWNRCCWEAGIYWGAIGINSAFGDTSSTQSNFRLRNSVCDSNPAQCGGVEGTYYEQNLNLPRDSLFHYQGEWMYIEIRIKLNTVAGVNDGLFEMWMDNCGPTLPGNCTGTETKVLSHTGIPFGKVAGTGSGLGQGGIGTIWPEWWSNPQVGGRPVYGTARRDNYMVATRFIGHYVPN